MARLRTLAEDAGLRDPADLAQQLLLLMDGAWVAARMFGPHNPGVQVAARLEPCSGRTTAEPGGLNGRGVPETGTGLLLRME